MKVSFWQIDKLLFASIEIKITSDVQKLTSTRDLGFKCLVVDLKSILLMQIAL